MSNVERIQSEIETFSDEEYSRLRQWFSEKDWGKWDTQVEADSKSRKLDFLVKEAFDEKSKETLGEPSNRSLLEMLRRSSRTGSKGI